VKQLSLLDDLKTKRCSRCEEIKSISEFNIDKKTKNKLRSECKECEREWRANL